MTTFSPHSLVALSRPTFRPEDYGWKSILAASDLMEPFVPDVVQVHRGEEQMLEMGVVVERIKDLGDSLLGAWGLEFAKNNGLLKPEWQPYFILGMGDVWQDEGGNFYVPHLTHCPLTCDGNYWEAQPLLIGTGSRHPCFNPNYRILVMKK